MSGAQTMRGQTALIMLLLGSSALALAGQAEASKRKPAPIVYADTPQPAATPGTDPAAPTGREARAGAVSGRRVEFRYPDRPEFAYGADGVRALGEAAPPFAFSSSTTAISERDAQAYAATPEPARDPSLTAGAFDARAAAGRASDPPRVEPPTRTAALSAPLPSAGTAIDYAAPRRVAPRFEPVAAAVGEETGIASWYGPGFDGKPTASGEIFDENALTGAHPTLPLPSLVEVTNLENGRKLVIRINDRGPFVDGRVIDVSREAARRLDFEQAGKTRVAVRYIGPADAGGGGGAVQTASLAPAAVAVAGLPPAATPAGYAMPAAGVDPYYVQLGAFADIGNAQSLVSRLSAARDVTILPVRVNGADLFRVMVGPVEGREAAERLRAELARAGLGEGMVRRVD